MSLNIGDNFKYLGKKFLDNRESFNTLEEMRACTGVPKGFITLCYEDNKRYEYNGTEWIPYITTGEVNLDGYAKIEDVPTKTSDLENDSNYATEVFVTTKIAEASLSGGEVDLSGFATKDDLPKSLSELINDMDFTTKQYVDETTAINVKNISYDTNINPKTFIDCLNEIISFFISDVIIYDNKIKFYHILRGKIDPKADTESLPIVINNKEYNNVTYISMLNVDYKILTTFIFSNEGTLRIETPFIATIDDDNMYMDITVEEIGEVYELKGTSDGEVTGGHIHPNKDVLDTITSEMITSWNNKSDVRINDDRNNASSTETYSSNMIENIFLEKDADITAISDDLDSMDVRVSYLEETANSTLDTIEKNRTDIDKILEAVDTPPTFTKPTLSLRLNKTIIEHDTTTSITITPIFNQNDGGALTSYILKKGTTSLVDSSTTQSYTDNIAISHGNSVTYTATVYYGDGESKQSTFGVVYDGLSAGNISANNTVRAYANSYYGVIDGNSVTDVTALTSVLGTSRGRTITYDMIKQRSVYMYPQSFGALTSIKDSNNFEYINSYTQSTISYNNVDYYIYILTDPVTITGFRQIFN